MTSRWPFLLREDVAASYDALAAAVADAVGAESCHLALYDPERRELLARRPRYGAPGDGVPRFRFPLHASPASERVVLTERPHLSNDPARDPLYDPSVTRHGVRSILTVPVHRDDAVRALLYAINRPGGFDTSHARALLELSDAVAVALANIALYASERDRRALHETLSSLSRELLAAPGEHTALDAAIGLLRSSSGAVAAAALLVAGGQLQVVATRGGMAAARVDAAGELGRVVRDRRSGEVAAPELLPGAPGAGPRGWYASPLCAGGAAMGALLAAFDGGSPGARERELIDAVASHAARFLQAGRSAGRERRALSRAAAVGRVTWMVASRGDTQAIFELAASELRALAGVERSVLYMHAEGSRVLVAAADAGLSASEQRVARERPIQLGTPLLAPVAERRVPIIVSDRHARAVAPFESVRAALLLPLVSHDEIIGMVSLMSDRPRHPFDAALVDFLQDVAQQIAFGVDNARLFTQLTRLASTDELTGLANRRHFMEVATRELARALRESKPLTLVLADIDHLKRINDSHGHAAGDVAIVHVARALEQHLGRGSLAARIGGEEYAVVLPDVDLGGAVETAERIRDGLSNAFVSGVGRVTASLGVASAPADGAAVDQLLKAADARLYQAKAAGRNRVGWSGVPPQQARLRYED